MTRAKSGRRAVLQAAGALIGGGSALSFAATARAWSLEPIEPEGPIGLAYSERCGGPAEHARLQSQLKAALLEKPSAPSLSAPCPICGCPITVRR
ncbi:hypothetical protein SAMN02745126_04885 [Enhydrobacter aerosaccus]|uniref:Tat (Twin-arginine translocation) pathway signal sequence n=1 Tax=Enhydrobacter aerosaccus TaxID=225324 RepID=A0A1T4SPE2_9HYPH|nr:hypothetical protein [Enhydrobacter aerosaccus]SKA30109.1 hypothetical protein SAMN02745126_04885 [Enhydrobacter aerosaccus]